MADENVGATPPDYETLAGKVRVLVGDTTPADLETPTAGLGQYAWYSDEELEVLGTLNGNNPKRVAVWVLSQVSISMSMLLKKWTSEDLQVDGPAITRGIENTLKRLAKEAENEDALTGDEEFFGVYGGQRGRGIYVAYPPETGIGWWSTY